MNSAHQDILVDIRRTITTILDKVEECVLPAPYNFEPDPHTGKVQVSWMLQEDRAGSRAVMNAFPGTWKQSRGSSAREPVWEHEEEGFEVQLFAHPETVQMSVQIP